MWSRNTLGLGNWLLNVFKRCKNQIQMLSEKTCKIISERQKFSNAVSEQLFYYCKIDIMTYDVKK